MSISLPMEWTEIDLILKQINGGLYDDRSALIIFFRYFTV